MKNILFAYLKARLSSEQIQALRKARDLFFRAGFLHKTYHPNNCLVLDITSECNLQCFNCQSSCRQAPSNKRMSLEQIERFVNEALELRYRWEKIAIHGGEPTLHPRFLDILEILKRYKNWNTDCAIEVTSNETGPKVKAMLSKIPDWAEIGGSNVKKEEGKVDYWFSSYNVAPIDLLRYGFLTDFSKGCSAISACFGLGLSRYGYYPCSPCANVDRVFGFDIGIKRLALVNERALRRQMAVLCRYCGHFKEPHEMVNEEKISRSWEEAYRRYRRSGPKLTLY